MTGRLEQLRQDDVRLEASERRADAEMDAASEREVVLRSGSIEQHLVGSLVLGRIPVRRTPEQQHGRPCSDGYAVHFGCPGGVAKVVAEGRFEPQRFLNE